MDKKFLISLGLSLATVWAFQLYWNKEKPSSSAIALNQEQSVPVQGDAVKVMAREDLLKPMKTESLFAATDRAESAQVELATDNCVALFDSNGGGLNKFLLKKYLGKEKTPLATVTKNADGAWVPPFGVFFDEAAPLAYTLVESSDNTTRKVIFEAEYQDWKITKEFLLNELSYRVDFTMTMQPLVEAAAPIKPRLFVAAPTLSELGDDQATALVFNENKKELEKKSQGAEAGFIWFWQTSQPLVGMQNKYFVHALCHDGDHFVQRAYFSSPLGMPKQMILEGPDVSAATTWHLGFYMGPKEHDELVKVDERLGAVLGGGYLGWLTTLMLKFFDYISQFINNIGFAIIVLAILLKLPLTPLSIYSRIKMERYQKHAPIINRIRAKYKNDAQLQMQEVTRYHQEHNLSPATPLIGCLPLLLQIPVMYSLYDILTNSIQLYHAPFFAWIVDLSSKDPFYVIPILMGITMFWQQAIAPISDEKQRVVMLFGSVVMTVIFAGLPVGLVLYWLVNNILAITEDYVRRWLFA